MTRITRRDFINGVATTAASSLFLPRWLYGVEEDQEPYPPALTGMRGSNDGSFEVAHQLKDGKLWEVAGKPEDNGETYDLVVVGAGISGLSAAWYYRKATGSKTRILLLDNHDDFGGHARRQEFGDKSDPLLITFGGSFAIESAAPYSPTAKSLIQELGIDVSSFRKYVRPNVYRSLGLANGFFFDKATFGVDRLLPDPFSDHYTEPSDIKNKAWELFLNTAPIQEKAKQDLLKLYKEKIDHYPGLTSAEKKEKLARISYADFLTTVASYDSGLLPFFQSRAHSLYGVGIDAIPAQDAWGLGFPGFDGMNLDPQPGPGMNHDAIYSEEADNYFFHFPDGNATIARLLVRKLIPDAIPGQNSEDIVLAKAKYIKLDVANANARIRLSSTVVKVENTATGVDIQYVQNKKLQLLRAKHCILACWHTVIPYICPELGREQKTALAYAIKVPLMYARVAVRNWKPWVKLGIQNVYAPGCYFPSMHLPIPLNIGGYKTAETPEEPTVICFTKAFCKPGLPIRHQHRAGRNEVLVTRFETFEKHLREQLNAILGGGGFDADRDITGIALHRWPHGYAYQYNSLYDPFWIEGKEGPCVLARQPLGRIAIANSDAAAYAYADAAIDQGYRAVQELLSTQSAGRQSRPFERVSNA